MTPQPGLPADLWDGMAHYLRGLQASLGEKPKAVVVISGHWLEDRPTVHAGANPELLFDYYGFPEHTYQLTWPAPGAPGIAARVKELLDNAGFATGTETARGWDHGVFVPFKLVWPDADVPVMQLSLRADTDPAAHLAIGRALAPLRDEGVLIVASGLSYHNLRDFFSPRGEAEATAFDDWLETTVRAPRDERDARLVDWRSAPGARASHPTPEHLLPLHVAAGAAGDDEGRRTYADHLLGKPVSAFQFG